MGSNIKSLRGLNKPKCILCGNVARSRCPFQSCKNCCAKAENPCHIHVLKAIAVVPEKTPVSGSSPSDHKPIDPPPPVSERAMHRLPSLRQLSNSFAQFNNLQPPMRSKRPVTKKEAAVINEWRFKKLKECKEGTIETEHEAFDRYMQNISLLEGVLAVNTNPEGHINDGSCLLENGHSNKMVLSALRLKQRSNPARSENLKKRVQAIVEQGLEKLRKVDFNHGKNQSNEQNNLVTEDGRVNFWSADRESSINDLLDRLSKARNEEDLRSCLEIKSHLFGSHKARSPMQTEVAEASNAEIGETDVAEMQTEVAEASNAEIGETDVAEMSNADIGEHDNQLQSDYSPPKWFSTGTIDQSAFVHIDSQFSLAEAIESL